MNLENIMEDWMGFVLIFLRKPISWLSLLAQTCLGFLGAGFLQIFLASAALFLSFFFFTTSPKQNPVVPSCVDNSKAPEQEEEEENESEFSEEQSSITEDSEFGSNLSDGTISDEESLIELFLPNGQYVEDEDMKNGNYNKPQVCLHKNIQDFTLKELLAEFNDMIEEDNLIEIDISMGSIKCSRCEIEA